MVMEFKDKKMQEPEDNMRYAEKKAVRMMNNGLNNQDDTNIDPNSLIVKEAFVNGGPVMKRFRASAMGRVSRRRRPSSHVVIILSDKG